MLIPKSVGSNKYPSFIRNNSYIKEFDQKKYFPILGLKNCSDDLVSYIKSASQIGLLSFVKKLAKSLAIIHCDPHLINVYSDTDEVKNIKMKASKYLTTISDSIQNGNPNIFILNSKIVLPFQMDIFDKSFKENSSLLTVLKFIKRNCDDFNVNINMENIFSEINNLSVFNQKGLKIIFSSSGNRGQWDIATMSMRGIKSCQRWDNTHSTCLIGSMVDPYAGILYITDNKNKKYGSKMIRRAVVRFVLNKQSDKKFILMERIYPHKKNVEDSMTIAVFRDFLQKKTNNKLPIIYGAADNYFIPISKSVLNLDHNMLSYRDSHISYQKSLMYYNVPQC